MEITPANRDDIPQLCSLLALLFTQEADFTPDANRQAAALRQIIERPDTGRILVLRDGRNCIGMVNLLFTVSTACGGKAGLLEDLIVDSAWRNVGLGSSLLNAAIQLARDTGCHRITLLTDRDNEAAKRFYQRHGFGPSAMVPLRLAITDPTR